MTDSPVSAPCAHAACATTPTPQAAAVPAASYLFTSESVTEGHPDKVCDQISDAILDAILEKEIELAKTGYVAPGGQAADVTKVRCACETMATTGMVIVAGEIRTQAYVDVPSIVRDVLREIGYDRAKYGFDCDTCGVINTIHDQSADIALGVDSSYEAQHGQVAAGDEFDTIGAGDQGMVFGYACNETKTLMPMPIYVAHRLAEQLTAVRKNDTMPYLRPDGKTQVSVRYVEGKPVCIEKVLISTQHAEEVDLEDLRTALIENVVKPVFAREGLVAADAMDVYVNPTGRFVIGGPMGDAGLTGRKIIVDTYGGMGRHGGGAFSGKDCTKVDRSAAYAARWVAKNVVAAGLADRCEIQVAYAIGMARPLSVMVETFGTNHYPVAAIKSAVEAVFDLRPGAIISHLELRRPIYQKTAAYGHFGRELPEFTWERTDKVAQLLAAVTS
ncbi:MAG: methionine adenosyltransferase [Eggerthellaceae bacterium]